MYDTANIIILGAYFLVWIICRFNFLSSLTLGLTMFMVTSKFIMDNTFNTYLEPIISMMGYTCALAALGLFFYKKPWVSLGFAAAALFHFEGLVNPEYYDTKYFISMYFANAYILLAVISDRYYRDFVDHCNVRIDETYHRSMAKQSK